MRHYHEQVESIVFAADLKDEDVARVLATSGEFDLVVMVTVNANLDKQQAALMQALLQADRRVIGIAVSSPYDLLAFPQLRTYLVTYEPTEAAQAAVVEVLFGQVEPMGRLPVSLPLIR